MLATVVRLLEATRMRVGNEEHARQNDSFGLTAATIVRRMRDLPGYELFRYNAYLKNIAGEEFEPDSVLPALKQSLRRLRRRGTPFAPVAQLP